MDTANIRRTSALTWRPGFGAPGPNGSRAKPSPTPQYLFYNLLHHPGYEPAAITGPTSAPRWTPPTSAAPTTPPLDLVSGVWGPRPQWVEGKAIAYRSPLLLQSTPPPRLRTRRRTRRPPQPHPPHRDGHRQHPPHHLHRHSRSGFGAPGPNGSRAKPSPTLQYFFYNLLHHPGHEPAALPSPNLRTAMDTANIRCTVTWYPGFGARGPNGSRATPSPKPTPTSPRKPHPQHQPPAPR